MLIAFAAYLALHFSAYVAFLRDFPRFRSERVIFLYHLAPAAMMGLAGLAYALAEPVPIRFAQLTLAVSAHGIYSLSFLELWSLAQGGYSLSILRRIADSETNDPGFSELARIGETKQLERIAGLARLGLVAEREGMVALTTRGSVVAYFLNCLLRWIDPDVGAREVR